MDEFSKHTMGNIDHDTRARRLIDRRVGGRRYYDPPLETLRPRRARRLCELLVIVACIAAFYFTFRT